MAQQKYSYIEFSGALQRRTTSHIRKPNEVADVQNLDFWTKLGAMMRRKGSAGSALNLPKLPDSQPTLSAFIARYPGLTEIWASNNVTVSESNLKYYNGSSWTNLRTGLPADAEINYMNDVEEVWAAVYDAATDTVIQPFSVDSTHSVSTTRHLKFGPAARFWIEFNGAVYGANVTVDGVRYRDRLYKSSGLTGVISFVRAPITIQTTQAAPTVFTVPIDIDSVRYLKPTMDIDIYKAGTSTRIYQATITAVDKILDTITIAADSLTTANTNVNTTTDVITVPSNTWINTGTPLTLWTSGAPGGTVNGTVYYAIRLTATTIKLATTYANALAGTAIDLTSQGTGSHVFSLALVFGNKDEIWGRDRKGKLTRYWNTDYRNPEVADWIKIPATLDATNDITAVGKLSNRMFIFTENSMIRFDGGNIVPLKNDIGCISQKTIVYYDSFMAWMDSNGQVWYRNEEAGEMDILSLPIEDVIKQFTQDELKKATAVCVGPIMKLYLGKKDGLAVRLNYHFQANQWSVHYYETTFNIQLQYKFQGVIKPHWFDEVGQMWVDEYGDDDNGKTIPFNVAIGDDTFGVDEQKSYQGVKLYSTGAIGTKVLASVDKGDFVEVGEITSPVCVIDWSVLKRPLKGTSINLAFTNSTNTGDPASIEKATIFYNKEEDTLRATKR